MRIGLSRFGYPEKRCITGTSHYETVNLRNFNAARYLSFIKQKLSIPQDMYKFHPFYERKDIDAYLFFNDVSPTRKNWVSIFETMIPRHHSVIDFHRFNSIDAAFLSNASLKGRIATMANDSCLGINALSESAKKIQLALLDFYPEYKEKIANKLTVTHAPQELIHNSVEKNFNDCLEFIYIGRDFYRKGGAEAVLAFDELVNEGILGHSDFKLTLIGSFDLRSNYALGKFDDSTEFHSRVEKIIDNHPSMTMLKEVPNQQVIEMIKNHHVGLLPTWADTYGYSVLEMQAAGLPVITTDVRALPEINYSDLLIPVEQNQFKEIVVTSNQSREEHRRIIIDGIKERVKAVFDDRSLISNPNTLLDKMKQHHDPETYYAALYKQISQR
ncbi:glycosyltransferase [Vibrio sp. TRT 17S01]|uniref:glycosyltransferase n=1 Tax=Vibrio sp. TRT 17S01 TaxID=3418505 RepID=UPI003CF12318